MEVNIFYGAGLIARNKLNLWEQMGLVPVCFVDADEQKQYKKFADKYEILPLKEAIAKYPEYKIYITTKVNTIPEIKAMLLNTGIPDNKIFTTEHIEHESLLKLDKLCAKLKDKLCLDENRVAVTTFGTLGDTYALACTLRHAQYVMGKKFIYLYVNQQQVYITKWFWDINNPMESFQISKHDYILIRDYRDWLSIKHPYIYYFGANEMFDSLTFNCGDRFCESKQLPRFPDFDEDFYINNYNIIPEKTVLIIPLSKCFVSFADSFWNSCAELFKDMGYKVIFNASSDEQHRFNGECAFIDLNDITNFANLCGNVFAIRTGLLDAISSTDAKMMIFQPSWYKPLDEMYRLDNSDNRIKTVYDDRLTMSIYKNPETANRQIDPKLIFQLIREHFVNA